MKTVVLGFISLVLIIFFYGASAQVLAAQCSGQIFQSTCEKISGCYWNSCDKNCSTTPPTNPTCARRCETNFNCLTGTKCVEGRCLSNNSSCSVYHFPSSCEEGTSCYWNYCNNNCGASPPSDPTCAGRCQSNNNCKSGTKCVAGRCTSNATPCSAFGFPSSCEASDSCFWNYCTNGCSGSPPTQRDCSRQCESNNNCNPGTKCNVGKCVPVANCEDKCDKTACATDPNATVVCGRQDCTTYRLNCKDTSSCTSANNTNPYTCGDRLGCTYYAECQKCMPVGLAHRFDACGGCSKYANSPSTCKSLGCIYYPDCNNGQGVCAQPDISVVCHPQTPPPPPPSSQSCSNYNGNHDACQQNGCQFYDCALCAKAGTPYSDVCGGGNPNYCLSAGSSCTQSSSCCSPNECDTSGGYPGTCKVLGPPPPPNRSICRNKACVDIYDPQKRGDQCSTDTECGAACPHGQVKQTFIFKASGFIPRENVAMWLNLADGTNTGISGVNADGAGKVSRTVTSDESWPTVNGQGSVRVVAHGMQSKIEHFQDYNYYVQCLGGNPAQNSVVNGCALKNSGDANCDGVVDGFDYSLWLKNQCVGSKTHPCNSKTDFNNDGSIDSGDYQIWLDNRKT